MTTCDHLTVATAVAVALASSALTPVYEDLGWVPSVLGAVVAVIDIDAVKRYEAHIGRFRAPQAGTPVS